MDQGIRTFPVEWALSSISVSFYGNQQLFSGFCLPKLDLGMLKTTRPLPATTTREQVMNIDIKLQFMARVEPMLVVPEQSP